MSEDRLQQLIEFARRRVMDQAMSEKKLIGGTPTIHRGTRATLDAISDLRMLILATRPSFTAVPGRPGKVSLGLRAWITSIRKARQPVAYNFV